MTELRAEERDAERSELRPWLPGDLLDNAAAAIARHRATALGAPLLAAVIVALVNGLLTRSAFPGGVGEALDGGVDLGGGAVAGYLVEAVALVTLSTVMSGLLALAVTAPRHGAGAATDDGGSRILPYGGPRVLPGLIGTALLVSLVVGLVAGLTLAAVIGLASAGLGDAGNGFATITALVGAIVELIVAVRLAMSGAVYALEGHRSPTPGLPVPRRVGPLAALPRSWRLTRKSFWRVLGLLLGAGFVVALVAYAIQGGVASLSSILDRLTGTAIDPDALTTYATGVAQVAVTVLQLSFVPAVVVTTYLDLRITKEGLDLWLRAATTGGRGA